MSYELGGRSNVTNLRNWPMLLKAHYRNRETVFYSPPNGDGEMWWTVTPNSLLLTELRH